MLRNKSPGKKTQKIPPGKNDAGNPPGQPSAEKNTSRKNPPRQHLPEKKLTTVKIGKN